MINWFFKKLPFAVPETAAPATKAKASPAPAPRPVAVKAKAQPPAGPSASELAAAQAALQEALQTALGDDAALLRLAQSAVPLDTKLAAVQAINGETALQQAERDFRSHDRKVHRLAKQRLQSAVQRDVQAGEA